ncbi:MAG TPA: NAD-dependent deacylase [Acidobacteriota bacterium]|nr:NAD-dependent deacylase [Acidobacteriota bacterium]
MADEQIWARAAESYLNSECVFALTGAGISADSGIPDFRSSGGFWERYPPEEFATLDAFLADPVKAWEFYRALASHLIGKEPNPAHLALAQLEQGDRLKGIITQNIDDLHQRAGSKNVFAVHGDGSSLHCLNCDYRRPADYRSDAAAARPLCNHCGFPLKPDVVLFGEQVRHMDLVDESLRDCDLLLVVGTSAQVYPVAEFPERILSQGGMLIEFNLRRTRLTGRCAFSFPGRAAETVPQFCEAVMAAQ